MTVSSLLKDLAHANKVLDWTNDQLLAAEKEERKGFARQLPRHNRPVPVYKETFAINGGRIVYNSIVADVRSALRLVSQLASLQSGRPLTFDGFDQYCKCPATSRLLFSTNHARPLANNNAKKQQVALARFVREQKHCSSGLEGCLRPTGREKVTDMEVFETYRAIGCQTVAMYEVSVHRVVSGACVEAVKLAGAIYGNDEGDNGQG
jgi:hypothetical protein